MRWGFEGFEGFEKMGGYLDMLVRDGDGRGCGYGSRNCLE